MTKNTDNVLEKPIETYIKEIEEKAKTMPKIEYIEIKAKQSIGEKIINFFKSLKK